MARWQVILMGDRTGSAETKDEAIRIGLADPGHLFGIEGQTGKPIFYLKRGSAAYRVSARVAAFELAMPR